MRHLLVVEKICYLSHFGCQILRHFPLSDLLHRSAKLKSSYVASSLLFSHMNVHEAGIDPFFSDGTVENVS